MLGAKILIFVSPLSILSLSLFLSVSLTHSLTHSNAYLRRVTHSRAHYRTRDACTSVKRTNSNE